MNTSLHRNHRRFSAVVFLAGILISSICWSDPDVVATYRGGTISQQDLVAEHQDGKPDRRKESATTDVESIVLRRALAGRMATLARPVRALCTERLQIRQAQLASQILKLQVTHQSQPSLADARESYDNNIERYRRPKQWRLRNIFLRVPDGASTEERVAVRDHLDELLSEVGDQDEFADLARSESDSPTAIKGGRIGFVSPSQLVPAIADAVKILQPGEISGIIETEDGFTALFCVGVRPGRVLSFEDVRTAIETRLKQNVFEESWAALNTTIRRRIAPILFPDAMESGTDGSKVLAVRTNDCATTISRGAYEHWATNRRGPTHPNLPEVEDPSSLNELALVFGQADEARRRGLTNDNAYRDRLAWDLEQTAAECVMEEALTGMTALPTDVEVAETYHENLDKFVEPPGRDLEVLRVEISPPDPQALFRRLQSMATEVRTGTTSLDEVALSLETDGHDVSLESLVGIQRFGLNSLGRGTAAAVMETAEGEITGPIQEQSDLLLIRVVAVRPSRQLTLEEATPEIHHYLEQQKQREARRKVREEILAEQEIVIH